MEAVCVSAECAICMEAFTADGDKAPHLLPACGHTYCASCIRNIARRDVGSMSIACPTCREVTRLDQSHPFPPKNFQLIDILARLSASSVASAQQQPQQQTPPMASAPDISMMDARPSTPASPAVPSVNLYPMPSGGSADSASASVMCAASTPPSASAPLPAAATSASGASASASASGDESAAPRARSIAFVDFSVQRRKVYELVHAWLKSLWFAPADLKDRAEVPSEWQSFLMPHWAFTVTMRARVTATEETLSGKKVTGRRAYETECSITNHRVCVCASVGAEEREFIDNSLGGTWDISYTCIHDPSQDPANAAPSSAAAQQQQPAAENEGFMGWFLKALRSVPLPAAVVGPRFNPLPAGADIVAHVQVETVWPEVRAKLTKKLMDECRDLLSRQAQEGVKRFTGTRIESSPPTFEARLIYLPIFMGDYRYDRALYRVCINGQNGTVGGDRPYGAPWDACRKAYHWLTDWAKDKKPKDGGEGK